MILDQVYPDETQLENIIEVLGMNGEELEYILDRVYIIYVKVDTNSCRSIKKISGQKWEITKTFIPIQLVIVLK